MPPRKRDLTLRISRSANDLLYRGSIVSGNGWTIAVGCKTFDCRFAARRYLKAQFGPGTKRKQVYKDSAGEWRFRIYLDGEQLFRSSEGYKNKSHAIEMADLVITLAIV